MRPEPWVATEAGLILTVRVTPKASKSALIGIVTLADGKPVLAIRVGARPVDGAANTALIQFLSKALDVRRSDIAVHSGETSRLKQLSVAGDPAVIVQKLRTWLIG